MYPLKVPTYEVRRTVNRWRSSLSPPPLVTSTHFPYFYIITLFSLFRHMTFLPCVLFRTIFPIMIISLSGFYYFSSPVSFTSSFWCEWWMVPKEPEWDQYFFLLFRLWTCLSPSYRHYRYFFPPGFFIAHTPTSSFHRTIDLT